MQGESYVDVVSRLKPVLEELETEADNLLIISHQATIRSVWQPAHHLGNHQFRVNQSTIR